MDNLIKSGIGVYYNPRSDIEIKHLTYVEAFEKYAKLTHMYDLVEIEKKSIQLQTDEESDTAWQDKLLFNEDVLIILKNYPNTYIDCNKSKINTDGIRPSPEIDDNNVITYKISNNNSKNIYCIYTIGQNSDNLLEKLREYDHIEDFYKITSTVGVDTSIRYYKHAYSTIEDLFRWKKSYNILLYNNGRYITTRIGEHCLYNVVYGTDSFIKSSMYKKKFISLRSIRYLPRFLSNSKFHLSHSKEIEDDALCLLGNIYETTGIIYERSVIHDIIIKNKLLPGFEDYTCCLDCNGNILYGSNVIPCFKVMAENYEKFIDHILDERYPKYASIKMMREKEPIRTNSKHTTAPIFNDTIANYQREILNIYWLLRVWRVNNPNHIPRPIVNIIMVYTLSFTVCN